MTYIKTSDGVMLAVEDIFPQGEKAVLFLHGWPLDHHMFEYQYDVLPRNGFRCVGMDLRGFGQSDGTVAGYTYNQMADDVYTVIRELRLHCCVLVGFSMGGAVALRYMARHKAYNVGKLALLAAAAPCFTQRPYYPYGMPKEGVDRLIAGCYTDRPATVSDFNRRCFANPHSPQVLSWFDGLCFNASSLGSIGCLYSLRDEDLRGDMAQVRCPTGIFHGKLDQICPYDFALQLQQGIRGSQLFSFEQSGHNIVYDELGAFNDTFLRFLSY